MALPGGEIDICNLASGFLHGERVANIYSPTTDTEKIYGRYYDETRQETLREYVPNFAKKRASLLKLSGTPLIDYTDEYALPADFIRLLSVGGDSEELQLSPGNYDLSETSLLANNGGATSIYIRYVADILDVKKWDSGFRKLVALRLAENTCIQITDDLRKLSMIKQWIKDWQPTAFGVDAQEKPPTVIDRSPLLERRGRMSGTDRDRRYLNL
jgi:hypothetical protein